MICVNSPNRNNATTKSPKFRWNLKCDHPDPRTGQNIGILEVQWFLGVKSKLDISRQSERSERLEVEGPKDLNILTSLSITDDMESWLVCKLVSVLMTYAIFNNGIWILMDITVAIFWQFLPERSVLSLYWLVVTVSKAHRIRKIVCNQFSSL